ncbi:hypothetical protein [Alkalicoccobacillus murimartini]|uniref:Secreted protein n=1 Tax=Alkalicoccobacillus murimartini TaxID=171685 RepID=A0ABT9YEV8_9BACI|nr:hypothetical protein [Alkalicoccobacillus murimartini]MDQ0206377.1 hypothetical protein [Alkalicoccobacillus murimartini]
MNNSALSKLNFSLLILCTVLLSACTGLQLSLSQGDKEEEPTEVTAEGLDESSFDYGTLYNEDFEVSNNFKYKSYPFLDIDKIDLDKVNDELLAFIIADLGLESAEITHEKEDDLVSENGTIVEEDEESEEINNEESDNSDSTDNESSLDEAQDEPEIVEDSTESKEEDSNESVAEGTVKDDGWIDGKGYPWSAFLRVDSVPSISVDSTTKTGVPHAYNPASDDFRYAPLTGESGLCPAEDCIPPRNLPSTAFFGEDGYIYDTEYAGTWEYYIDDVEKWTFYAWNFN